MKHKSAGLLVVAAGIAVAFAGCGGGNDNVVIPTSVPTTTPIPTTSGTATPTATVKPTSVPTGTQRFAGQYTGAYVVIGSQSGADVGGNVTATVATNGSISATINQSGGPSASANGTVTSAGAVNVSASGSVLVPSADVSSRIEASRVSAVGTPVPTATLFAPTPTPGPITVSYTTKLSGTATINNSDSVLLGTILTTQSNGNNPRGRFVGIRNMTTASVYAGTYSGTTTAAATSTGDKIPAKLAFTVSTNGLIRGTYARTASGVRVRPLIGTIDASGKATFIALSEEENPVGSGTYTLVVTTLAGQGTTTGSAKISGTLVRAGTSAVNASGTFTATRTSTTTD